MLLPLLMKHDTVGNRRAHFSSQPAKTSLYAIYQSLPSPRATCEHPDGLRSNVRLYDYQLVRALNLVLHSIANFSLQESFARMIEMEKEGVNGVRGGILCEEMVPHSSFQ
jgi:hypothetical protein